MRRVSPSMIAREELQRLLPGGADRESSVVSALVEVVTRVVVEELLEAEQADYLGGRGRYCAEPSGRSVRGTATGGGSAPRRVRSRWGAARPWDGYPVPLVADELPGRQQRGAGPAGDRDIRPRVVHPGCGGRVPGRNWRAADLHVRRLGDHRSAMG
jgi:hypothetical protein